MPDPEATWARASVLRHLGGTKYEVRIDGIDDNDEPRQSRRGAGEVRRVDLAGESILNLNEWEVVRSGMVSQMSGGVGPIAPLCPPPGSSVCRSEPC